MCLYAGMKAIPRFREAIAFLKLRHQPAHIKYPLIALQVASNPGIYSAEQLNVKEEVRHLANNAINLNILRFEFNYATAYATSDLQFLIDHTRTTNNITGERDKMYLFTSPQ